MDKWPNIITHSTHMGKYIRDGWDYAIKFNKKTQFTILVLSRTIYSNIGQIGVIGVTFHTTLAWIDWFIERPWEKNIKNCRAQADTLVK